MNRQLATFLSLFVSSFLLAASVPAQLLPARLHLLGHLGGPVLDVADPHHVREIGYHTDGDYAFDVLVAGDAVYLADRFGGLQIYDRLDWPHP
jgi:hypothetical protein